MLEFTIYLMPTSTSLSTSTFLKDQRGLLPLFFLVAIGVAVLVGGTYIIREQYVRTGKSGQAELDTKKIQEELYTQRSIPPVSTPPRTEKQYGAFKYEPSPPSDEPSSSPGETQSSNVSDSEPSFSIYPPSGWSKSSQSDSVIKVVFLAPEKDEEVAGDDLQASNKAKIQVNMVKGNGSGDLESLVNYFINSSKSDWESFQVNSKSKTTFAGLPAYKIEIDAFRKGVTFRTLSYVFIKGKYGIVAYGGALKSAWDKRASEINSSLNSFKLSN